VIGSLPGRRGRRTGRPDLLPASAPACPQTRTKIADQVTAASLVVGRSPVTSCSPDWRLGAAGSCCLLWMCSTARMASSRMRGGGAAGRCSTGIGQPPVRQSVRPLAARVVRRLGWAWPRGRCGTEPRTPATAADFVDRSSPRDGQRAGSAGSRCGIRRILGTAGLPGLRRLCARRMFPAAMRWCGAGASAAPPRERAAFQDAVRPLLRRHGSPRTFAVLLAVTVVPGWRGPFAGSIVPFSPARRGHALAGADQSPRVRRRTGRTPAYVA
jgi:hypothetical protein